MKLFAGDINILADLPADWQERIGKAFGVILIYADRDTAEGYETSLNEVEIEKGEGE